MEEDYGPGDFYTGCIWGVGIGLVMWIILIAVVWSIMKGIG